ncbi:FKBP-type peptidyl-prolyl cis-trans isomerase [Halonotius pteroides]|uniref:Peptidyl-prolyl cis-trans isomerase n=1 Tax=Halonotius pteroides TaxID=268735 RepID=A0A3A6QMA3_9EURY|nr:FKBP-type peptidyl-prolyl cis-trans isomerase [Halonotius pteroides]RJX48826.1 peptidylprolyl isomerase [Halonotius pteroides]
MTIESGDEVVIEYVGRDDDGTVFDTSREAVAAESGLAEAQPDRKFTPLTVSVGAGEVIAGIEEALPGLDEGETTSVDVPPEKGYGEWSEDRVQEYETDELAATLGGQRPAVGQYVETEQGAAAEITDVADDVSKVDFNPPLAGETLHFELEVVAIN